MQLAPEAGTGALLPPGAGHWPPCLCVPIALRPRAGQRRGGRHARPVAGGDSLCVGQRLCRAERAQGPARGRQVDASAMCSTLGAAGRGDLASSGLGHALKQDAVTCRKTTWPAGGTEATSGPVDVSGQPPLPAVPGLGARGPLSQPAAPRPAPPSAAFCSPAAPPQASGVCGPCIPQVAVVRGRGPRSERGRRSNVGWWPRAQEGRGRAGCRPSSSDPDPMCSALPLSCLGQAAPPEGLRSDQSLPVRAPWETLATGEKPDSQALPEVHGASASRTSP